MQLVAPDFDLEVRALSLVLAPHVMEKEEAFAAHLDFVMKAFEVDFCTSLKIVAHYIEPHGRIGQETVLALAPELVVEPVSVHN